MIDYALNSIGHQQLTVSSTAVSLTVPTGTRPTHALITVQVDSVRWRADGTAPTAAIGNPIFATSTTTGVLDLTDPQARYQSVIKTIQFIRVTTDATLDIEYFG